MDLSAFLKPLANMEWLLISAGVVGLSLAAAAVSLVAAVVIFFVWKLLF